MARKAIQKTISQKRINEVVQWLLDGYSFRDIAEAAGNDVDFNALIKAAFAQLQKDMENNIDRTSWHLEARRELYRKSLEISDFKTAHSILVDMAKLEKLNAPKSDGEQKPDTPKDKSIKYDFMKVAN